MSIGYTLRKNNARLTEEPHLSKVMVDPSRFATKFNAIFPGAYRPVNAADIREMAQCGLIGRHGFFERVDFEIVRGILRYEQLRGKRMGKSTDSMCEQMTLLEKS